MIQGGCIVRTVSGYGDYGSFLLKQLHKTLFVRRAGARHDFEVHHTVQRLFITQFGKGNTGDTIPVGICFRLPQSDLTGNFRRSSRCVTGNDRDTDTSRLAFGHGGGYIRTNRV